LAITFKEKQVLETLRKRLGREENESGFTLIELMVVVLIIAILIAIAIPTFLGARTRAQDRQAQSNLRNAFAAEKVVYTDDQEYTTNAGTLSGIEPSLSYVAGAAVESATSAKSIYVVTESSDATVILGAQSKSGKCFYMKDSANAPTEFAEDADGTCANVASAGLTWETEW
jgi:type IV pilus assembly protein PilA